MSTSDPCGTSVTVSVSPGWGLFGDNVRLGIPAHLPGHWAPGLPITKQPLFANVGSTSSAKSPNVATAHADQRREDPPAHTAPPVSAL